MKHFDFKDLMAFGMFILALLLIIGSDHIFFSINPFYDSLQSYEKGLFQQSLLPISALQRNGIR